MAKKTQKTVLVTGATGTQGGAVLNHLRKTKVSLRALARDPDRPDVRALVGHGASVVKGDLSDPASLGSCLDEVDSVFSVQDATKGREAETAQGINLAEAANKAGVSHFVYSSVASANRNTGIPHFESKFAIEEKIRALGLPHTIFRPVFFMENWVGNREQIENGILATPLSPDTRLQIIAVDDIARFVVAALDRPGKWLGKVTDIAGDELSMNEVAAAFTTVVGKEVKYQQVPWEQFEKQAGSDLTIMFRWLDKVGYNVDIEALRSEMSNLTSFERWLNTNWANAAKPTNQAASA
jgi:uncharacterized protein YbjT (DUF2867 family)